MPRRLPVLLALALLASIASARTRAVSHPATLRPDAATVTVKAGGSSGTTILVVKAAANATATAPLNVGVPCSGGIHATLAGTSPNAAFVYS
jgi:hypothetical protein